MIRLVKAFLLTSMVLLAGACGTTDSAIQQQGHGDAYLTGFHDGRHSGMKEAGNNWEHYIRDHERFENDTEYREGWLAGEIEGKRLQAQAQAIGEAVGGAYSGYQIGKEADKAGPHPQKTANEVLKNVDTDELKVLEQ